MSMFSDSDDDSQASQPHLRGKFLNLKQRHDKSVFDNLDKKDYTQQFPSLDIEYSDKSLQTSPTQKPSSLCLFESIYDPCSSSPTINPFKSKYMQIWQQKNLINFVAKSDFVEHERLFDEKYNYSTQRFGVFNFQFDEELFYKVKKLFPSIDPEEIRGFLYKYKNQEHDIIAAAINSLNPSNQKKYLKKLRSFSKSIQNFILSNDKAEYLENSNPNDDEVWATVDIRLRYLKLLYPDVCEIKLFFLLHNCDIKTNIVAKKLEEEGYKRKSFSQDDIKSNQEIEVIEEIMKDLNLNLQEQEAVFLELEKRFPEFDKYLLKVALNCTNFDLKQSTKILNSCNLSNSRYIFDVSKIENIVNDNFNYLYSRGTQTFSLDYFEFDITKINKNKQIVALKNASTWTNEDDIQIKDEYKFHSKGPNPKNRKGPAKHVTKLLITKGPNPKNRQGVNLTNAKGPNPTLRKALDFKLKNNIKEKLAKGANPKNKQGPSKKVNFEDQFYIKNLLPNL